MKLSVQFTNMICLKILIFFTHLTKLLFLNRFVIIIITYAIAQSFALKQCVAESIGKCKIIIFSTRIL